MASIDIRKSQNGEITYRVRVRVRGKSTQTATFNKLSDAKKWASITEGMVLQDKYLPSKESKKHTMREVIDRYLEDILPHKSKNTIYNQTLELQWWSKQIGH